MSDTLGRITVPAPPSSGATFPFSLTGPAHTDYPPGMTRDWDIIEHRFQGDATLAVQRFSLGSGARKFTFRMSAMSWTQRQDLINFYDLVQGSFQTFLYNVPNPDQSTYTSYTVVFETAPLSIDHLASMCRVGITFVEIVSGAEEGPYSISSTCVRFPSTALAAALLSQVQTIIPLIHIKVRDPGVPDLYLSDRRVTVGGHPYLPRVLDLGEPGSSIIMSQDITGASDNVQFTFGNADRAMSLLVQDTSIKFAQVDLSLYHVQSGILLQLWKGIDIDWKLDGSAPFPIRCSDGLYPLTQNYPRRTITRQCWKPFNAVLFAGGTKPCPYSSVGSGGDPNSCDYFFNSPNGCLAHNMSPYFGAHPAMPQSVVIKDDGTGVIFGIGRATVTSTSIVSDSIWGQPLPEIWCNDWGNPQQAYWANTIVAAVRDESTYEDVLGIVGVGPIGQYEGMSVQTNADGYTFLVCPLADGFPPQGFQVNGNFQITKYQPTYGLREVTGADPASPTTDPFSLGHGGGGSTATPNLEQYDVPDPVFSNILTGQPYDILPFAAGTAFVELRYQKSAGTGITPTTAESHSMVVPIARGLTGVTFDSSGTPTLVPGLVNNAWVAVNTYFRALGIDQAPTATQLSSIILPSIFAGDGSGAAEICDLEVVPVVGTAPTTYVITPAGAALNSNINVPANTFTYQSVLSITDALADGYISMFSPDLYVLTDQGTALQGQIIQPTPGGGTGFDGSFTYPTQISLTTAVSLGYAAPSVTSGLERQFQFQGTLTEFKPFRDWMTEILKSCLGWFTFEFGALKLGIRENASATASFSSGNMLYQSLIIQPSPVRFEYYRVNFANSAIQYQLDMGEYQDKDFSAYMGRAGAPLTSQQRYPGCSTISQALRLAVTMVREEIGGILRPDQSNPYIEFDNNNIIQFKTTILALDTEVGDVIEVTHPDLPTYPGPVGGSPLPANTWKFRITKWVLNKDWSITIQAKSVTDSMYDLDVGPKPADVPVVSPNILFYPEPLSVWLPYQTQAALFDPVYHNDWSFDVQQTYNQTAAGVLAPFASVTAHLPVNQFIPLCTPPVVKAGALTQFATGGFLPGYATYRVQVCATNAAGNFSPPSEVLIVQIPGPAGLSSSFTISGIKWPQISGLTGYTVFASTEDDTICEQFTGSLTQLTAGPYTYSPTSITVTSITSNSTFNVPNANLAVVRAKAKRLIHGGPEGLGVTSVSSAHIVCTGAIDGTAVDNWAGRVLYVIGRPAGAGPVPFASYTILGFTVSTGDFHVTPSPLGVVLPGDDVVVSFLSYDNSATPTVLTDAGLSNITNGHMGETVNDPNRIGNYIRVWYGYNAGAMAKIVSNTSTSYTLDTPLVIKPGSFWTVEVAAWDNSTTDLALTNADPTASTTLLVPVQNYSNLPVLIGLFNVDNQGNESSEDNVVLRPLFISGAQGSRLVTANTTQTPTDGTLEVDPSGVTSPTAITLVSPGMDNSTTTCPISDGTNVVNGTLIAVDTSGNLEVMLVESGGGIPGPGSITVTRAQSGTTAVAHTTGVGIVLPGALLIQLLDGSVVPNQKLVITVEPGSINYAKVLSGGADTFPDGSTGHLVLPGTSYYIQLRS